MDARVHLLLDVVATMRLFRNGHSQAVRIPAGLAYECKDLELEIERVGDELRIRPAGRPIAWLRVVGIRSRSNGKRFEPQAAVSHRYEHLPYLMKQQPPHVAERFARCRVGDVVISAITAAELEYGVVASGDAEAANREALHRFLLDVPVAPLDVRAACAYGPARWLSREGRRDALDKLIAAHAMALGVVLVTNNPSDFQAYPDLAIEKLGGDALSQFSWA